MYMCVCAHIYNMAAARKPTVSKQLCGSAERSQKSSLLSSAFLGQPF